MNRIGIPESEQPALLAYLKRTYRYEDGGIVNRRTGRRVQGSKMRNGYLGFTISFNGNNYLREVSQSDNNLNTLLAWEPNKDTGVTGVAVTEHGYQSKIQGRNFHFRNPYEAFYWAIACGKRYRA